jgi:hypothetical protein
MNDSASHTTNWLAKDWTNWKYDLSTNTLFSLLRDYPEKLEALLSTHARETFTIQFDDRWSVQEHVGHLLAMESLWIARLDDFVLGHTVFRPWNGHNNDVRLARFNEQTMRSILRDFKTTRLAFVEFSEEIMGRGMAQTVLLERLGRHFSFSDHLAFIAEHDAHHFHTIQTLLKHHHGV